MVEYHKRCLSISTRIEVIHMEPIVKSMSDTLLLFLNKAEQASADVLSLEQLRAAMLRGFDHTENE